MHRDDLVVHYIVSVEGWNSTTIWFIHSIADYIVGEQMLHTQEKKQHEEYNIARILHKDKEDYIRGFFCLRR